MDEADAALDHLYNVILDVRAELAGMDDPTVEDVKMRVSAIKRAADDAVRGGVEPALASKAYFNGYQDLVSILGASKPESVWQVQQSRNVVIRGGDEDDSD